MKPKRRAFAAIARLGRELETNRERVCRLRHEISVILARALEPTGKHGSCPLPAEVLQLAVSQLPVLRIEREIPRLGQLLGLLWCKRPNKRVQNVVVRSPGLSLSLCRALLKGEAGGVLAGLTKIVGALCALPAPLVSSESAGQLLECLGRLTLLGHPKHPERMVKELAQAWPAAKLLAALYQVQDSCPDITGKVLAQIAAGLSADHPQLVTWLFRDRAAALSRRQLCLQSCHEVVSRQLAVASGADFQEMVVQLSREQLEPANSGCAKHWLRLIECYLSSVPDSPTTAGILASLWALFERQPSLAVLKALAVGCRTQPALEPAKSLAVNAYLRRTLGRQEIDPSKLITIFINLPDRDIVQHARACLGRALSEHAEQRLPTARLVQLAAWGCADPDLQAALLEELASSSPSTPALLAGMAQAAATLGEAATSQVLQAVYQLITAHNLAVLPATSQLLSHPIATSRASRDRLVVEVFAWVHGQLLTGTRVDFALQVILALGSHLALPRQVDQLFRALLAERQLPDTPERFAALSAVYQCLAGTEAEAELAGCCIGKLAFMVDAAPADALPALYSLAHQCFTRFPYLEEWANISQAVIDRLPAFARHKSANEALLLGAIAAQRRPELLRYLAPYASKSAGPARAAFVAVVGEISRHTSLSLTVPYLISLYQPGVPREQLQLLGALQHTIDHCYRHGVSCRAAATLLLGPLHAAIASGSPGLQIAGCKLAQSMVRSAWGTPADYRTATALLNLVFPLLLSKPVQSSALQTLSIFGQRLSLPFLANYLIPGLTHPNATTRRVFQQAYLVLTHQNPSVRDRAQEVVRFLFSAK